MNISSFIKVMVLWTIFTAAVLLTAWRARSQDVSYSNLFYALGQIESGNNDNAVGSHGERGRYQMTQRVWREFNPPDCWKNFKYMTNSDFAFCSATGVMLYRGSQFYESHNRKPTVSEWAMLWRAPARVNHPTSDDLDYCQRFFNLVNKCAIENKNRNLPTVSRPVK